MKMKPILFNTEMVKSTLADIKTQTRRIIKDVAGLNYIGTSSTDGKIFDYVSFGHGNIDDVANIRIEKRIKIPYFVGDILYVRETWQNFEEDSDDGLEVYNNFVYYADHNDVTLDYIKWRPSIHMPKKAARIFLEVTNVRIERIQDITEEDAKAEGALVRKWYQPYGTKKESSRTLVSSSMFSIKNFKTGFAHIWEQTLRKPYGWKYKFSNNPWVWVIEFKRIEKPRG